MLPYGDNFENLFTEESKPLHAMLCRVDVDTRQEDKELQGRGDLSGRFLYLSTVKELNLKRVLAYPLTSIPLTFVRIDGL